MVRCKNMRRGRVEYLLSHVYSIPHPRYDLPDDCAQCRSKFLRSCTPDFAGIKSICRDKGKRVQEIRERQPIPNYMCR